MGKVISLDQAIGLIPNGATVCVGGFASYRPE